MSRTTTTILALAFWTAVSIWISTTLGNTTQELPPMQTATTAQDSQNLGILSRPKPILPGDPDYSPVFLPPVK